MAEWNEQYEQLDEDDKQTADQLIGALVHALLKKDGAVIVLADPEGLGVDAQFYYGGNELLVGPLMRAGAAASRQYFEGPTGTLQ